MSKFEELMEQERVAEEALEGLKKDIVDRIRAKEAMKGVTLHQDGNIRGATVQMSTVASNGFNLSARTYIPDSQADAVRLRIAGAMRTCELVQRLKDMLVTGSVRFGANDRVVLNADTLGVIHTFLEG